MHPVWIVLAGAAGLALWVSQRVAARNAVVVTVKQTSVPTPDPRGWWNVPVVYTFSDGTTMPDTYRVSKDVVTSPQFPQVMGDISKAFIGETRGQIEGERR